MRRARPGAPGEQRRVLRLRLCRRCSIAMHQFGVTRSVRRQDQAVFTPDTCVRAALPGMRKADAIAHAAPAIGAAVTRYTEEVEAGGCLAELATACERL